MKTKKVKISKNAQWFFFLIKGERGIHGHWPNKVEFSNFHRAKKDRFRRRLIVRNFALLSHSVVLITAHEAALHIYKFACLLNACYGAAEDSKHEFIKSMEQKGYKAINPDTVQISAISHDRAYEILCGVMLYILSHNKYLCVRPDLKNFILKKVLNPPKKGGFLLRIRLCHVI